MPPATSDPVAHDLSPEATPGRRPLPASLRLLPWLCLVAISLGVGDAAWSALRLHQLRTDSESLRARIEAATAENFSLNADLAALDRAARRADALACWVTAGCHAQAFLLSTLRALPAGVPAHRIGFEFQEVSRQAEVVMDLGGAPEVAAAALARIEAQWTEQRIRVSARESGAGDDRRRVHRMSLNLPEPGRSR